MKSFLKFRANSRSISYMNIELASLSTELTETKSGFGMQVPMMTDIEGNLAGLLEEGEGVTFHVGDLKPEKYHVEIHVNPMLHSLGYVSAPTLMEPGDMLPLFISFAARETCNLLSIEWLCRLYLRA